MGLLSAIGAIGGNLIAPGIGGSIGGTIGGMLEGGGSSGSNVTGAYNTASAAQQQAAQNAMFTPVGITTNFGSSQFTVNPQTGQLQSAGYTLAPQLQGLQTGILGNLSGALSQAQGVNTSALNQGAASLYNLGLGYLGQSPQQVQQNYLQQQNALLAPQNEQALAAIRNRLFQSGRTGLATGGTTTGMAQTNPELAAYYNSLAQQQNQLAAGAQQAAQNQITFGQGLLAGGAGLQSTGYGLQSAAYTPLQTQLGIGTQIEAMGQQALGLGSELGGQASTAGAAAGQLASTAAQTGLAGQIAQQGLNATANTSTLNQLTGLFGQGSQGALNTPGYAGQLGNWFNNLIGGGSAITNTTGYNTSAFSPDYGTSSGAGYTFY